MQLRALGLCAPKRSVVNRNVPHGIMFLAHGSNGQFALLPHATWWFFGQVFNHESPVVLRSRRMAGCERLVKVLLGPGHFTASGDMAAHGRHDSRVDRGAPHFE